MNSLVKKYAASIVRSAMVAAAAFLVAHKVLEPDKTGVLASSELVDVLVSILLWVIAQAWSFVQHHTQERLFQTALKASPKTPAADVVGLVKAGLGAQVSTLGKLIAPVVLVLLLFPSFAGAQSLVDQGVRYARDLEMQTSAAPDATVAKQLNDDQWGLGLKIGFLAVNSADLFAGCAAMRQLDKAGNQVNTPSNAIIPAGCTQALAVKAGVVTGALVAFDKLWPEHKWEAVSTLVGATLGSLVAPQQSAYDPPATGNYPVPVAARRVAVAFTFQR